MTTYYVNNSTGSNSYNGESPTVSAPDGPFLTLQYAVAQLSAGDTLEIMEGTGEYTDNWLITTGQACSSGTATQKITVKNYSTDLPEINPVARIEIHGVSHWVIDGLDFREFVEIGAANAGVVSAYGDYITLQNGYLRHATLKGLKLYAARNCTIDNWTFDNLRSRDYNVDANAILLTQEVTDLIVRNCTFSDIGSDGIQSISSHSTIGALADVVIHDILIENNTFKVIDPYAYRDATGTPASTPTTTDGVDGDGFDGSWVGENGIDLKLGYDITIRGNTFSGFRKTTTYQDNSGSTGPALILHDYIGNAFVDHGYSIVVEQNKFFDCQTCIEIGAHESAAPNQGNHGVIIKNNKFLDDRRSPVGLAFDTGAATYAGLLIRASAGYLKVYHNSFNSVDDANRILINANPATGSNIEFKNNAFSDGKVQTVSGYTWDYSGYETGTVTWDADGTGANDVTAVDIGMDTNLEITASSALYNSGVAGIGVNNDYNNNPRPGSGASAAAPDIGAYEVQDDSGGSVASAPHTYSLRRKIAAL